MNIFKNLFLFISMLICIPMHSAHARELARVETPDAAVICDQSLVPAAKQVITMYSALKDELEATFLWEIDFKPVIVLLGERQEFQQMAGHRSYVAYALPQKKLIVIDYSRMHEKPFALDVTLKHELCHLLLHRHIENGLPKWLDEGVAQWISDGISEIVSPRNESLLTQAALSGSLLRLENISGSFPGDERRLILAYEQSRSIVDYIIENYGKNGLLNILESMRKGTDHQDAIGLTLMISYSELERRWQEDQQSMTAVLAYFATNLYTIIFILAALITFLIYIRLLIRKRRLQDEPGEDEELPPPESFSP